MCDCLLVFFFKQKTAYEMRISDWSSDVCSSVLGRRRGGDDRDAAPDPQRRRAVPRRAARFRCRGACAAQGRSEEHTSELQSLMRISYAVFCLKKKTPKQSHMLHNDTIFNETKQIIPHHNMD